MPRRRGTSEHIPDRQGVMELQSGVGLFSSQRFNLLISLVDKSRGPFCQRTAQLDQRVQLCLEV